MSNQERVKILIVDDLPEKLLVYDAILRELDQELVMVRTGEEALREVLNHEFAVILLDVNMPGMDGFEAAKLIRSRKKSAHTPIIFVTAFNDELRMAEGYSSGAVDFISTPIVPQILRAKVRVFVDLFRMTLQVREHAQQQIAFSAERSQRAAAEEANRRLSYLVKAGGIITRSLDHRVITQNILRLLTPDQADSAALALTEVTGWSIAMASSEAGEVNLAENVELAAMPPRWRAALDQVVSARPANASRPGEPGSSIIESHFLALPLRDRERVFGVLMVAKRPESTSFAPAEIQVLESITSRSAIALTNARLYEEVEFANQQKNRFLSMLAHELRNPLAPIQSAIDLMRLCRIEEEELRSAREVIGRQVSHLVRLVDDLLDVSRITLGKIRLAKERFDARNVVDSALEISRPLIDDLGHVLTVEAPAEVVLVEGDAARLAQVLSNLLNNAAKYTPHGGKITLRLESEQDQVIFLVRDSGVGIPPHLLTKVFDLFTQVDNSIDRSHGGLGIGLTLVRELVDLHNGRVDVSCAGVGKGCEFRVYIPRAVELLPVADHGSTHTGANAVA